MRAKCLLMALGILAACGGRGEFAQPQPVASQAPVSVTLPAPKPATPAFRVTLKQGVGRKTLRSLARIKGVSIATPVAIAPKKVIYQGHPYRLRVASVDPLALRSVAPTLSRDAEFVWAALVGNRAVLTPKTATKLGFDTAGGIRLGHKTVDVGAFADNGIPNFADVIVSNRQPVASLAGRARMVVIGSRDGADLSSLAESLRDKLGHRAQVIHRLQPKPARPAPTPNPVGTVEGGIVGRMNFEILKDGYIKPDPAWVAANIATGTVPILGSVTCNRIIFPQLGNALAEIEREGLAGAIHPNDYGGCYVPRFIDRDPRRGLSEHAFGLALDINVSENYLGTRGHMDPRVVSIFESWGFEWGGRWSRPDPMHFQLDRLIQN